MSATNAEMKKLKPYASRATVMPSNVDEEQTAAGVILPLQHDDAKVTRAVLVDFDARAGDQGLVVLQPGTVVYYRRGSGFVIGDVTVIEVEDILAYEDA